MKDELNRVRISIRREYLYYLDDIRSLDTNLLKTKILINSTISNAAKWFISLDIKDYFLATSVKDSKFIKVQFKYIPEDIHKRYNLEYLITSDDKCI